MDTTTVTLVEAGTPAQLTRDQVPEHLTWNLTSIYATNHDWEGAFAAVAASIPSLSRFDGQLKSAEVLAEALLARDAANAVLAKLEVFASMRLDQDTTNDLYKSMDARIRTLLNKAADTTSYLNPQLLKIAKTTLKGWITETKL